MSFKIIPELTPAEEAHRQDHLNGHVVILNNFGEIGILEDTQVDAGIDEVVAGALAYPEAFLTPAHRKNWPRIRDALLKQIVP